MEFLSLLYALFIGPLELFFEVLYAIAYRFVGDPGLTIVFLSLAMNFLVLPLYHRADAMQEAERQRAIKMKPWTDHIKKTFKGDERFMMMQTYNRQCGYKPTDALKGSVSLLLEIPFFIAAYHFLSNLTLLQGVPFGPIADLGAPDALLAIGGITINVLPILMTAINLVSTIVYMKGLPLSNKIQMYGIAAIFLVLLYNSPAGLVFYWTLNNVFSLVKNIFYRLKDPKRVLCILASVAGLALLVFILFVHPLDSMRKQAFVVAIGLALQVPIIWRTYRQKYPRTRESRIPEAGKGATRSFLLCGLALALLTGALIPIAVIQASPTEFVSASSYSSPLWYVAHSLATALGTFIIWFGVFYWLATPRAKTIFGAVMFALVGIAVVDYLFFVPELGNLSPNLQYLNTLTLSLPDVAINALVVIVVAALLVFLWLNRNRWATVACACLCVAAIAVCGTGIFGINQSVDAVMSSAQQAKGDSPNVTLSKDGKNVVVIMMDRAIGYYLPYLVYEKPELQEKLQGFTYYPNAVSYGIYTNMGTPGLYGGYDYVPESMNARDDQLLVEKHNEALKVMPAVFAQAGFETTFFDPTYAGYTWTPDLSVFDDMPDLHLYITMNGTWDTREGFNSETMTDNETKRKHNFFCYSLFRVAPVIMRPILYQGGDYNSTAVLSDAENMSQKTDGESKSEGLNQSFLESYSALQHLSEMTSVEEGAPDAFFVMSNDTTHEIALLQEPDYIPATSIDNTAYDEEHRQRYAADGSFISFPEEAREASLSPAMHYEVNMAALRELCNWFDYLREQGVWDNTRIIVVSDHGSFLESFDDLVVDVGEGDTSYRFDLLFANCLLMVKDFDSDEFTVDEQFMTNADTPALAMEGLVDDPVNPFTGNAIDTSGKADGAHVLFSYDYDTTVNNGYAFLPGTWFEVNGDIFEPDNWEYLGYY